MPETITTPTMERIREERKKAEQRDAVVTVVVAVGLGILAWKLHKRSLAKTVANLEAEAGAAIVQTLQGAFQNGFQTGLTAGKNNAAQLLTPMKDLHELGRAG